MARPTSARDRLVRVTAPTAALCAVLLSLGGCIGSDLARRATGPQAELTPPAAVPGAPGPAPTPAPMPAAGGGGRIGAGSVKVALVLPLTGQGSTVGAAMRDAAQLAYDEAQQPDLTLLVEDDRGSPDGAREATQEALRQGAEIVLGPLFAGSVQAAAAVARTAGKPVIGFSTDATVANPGVYLLSFLPQPEVDRVIEDAVAGGKRSFAALIPETAYGNAVEAEFREVVARKGARVAAVERYPAGAPVPAVERLARVIAGPGATADALFIPETADAMPTVAAALTKAGFSPARVRPSAPPSGTSRRSSRCPPCRAAASPRRTASASRISARATRRGSAPSRPGWPPSPTTRCCSRRPCRGGTARSASPRPP